MLVGPRGPLQERRGMQEAILWFRRDELDVMHHVELPEPVSSDG